MNNGNSSETQPGLLNPLSAEELTRLDMALDAVAPMWGIAARLMGRLGLRVGEVAKLCWRHVEIYPPGEPTIHIVAAITKTGYARSLPIPSTLTELLIEHRHHSQEHWQESDRGKEDPAKLIPFLDTPVIWKKNGSRISPRWFQIVITTIGAAAVGRKIRPHTLRHTFATRLLQQTNIRVVQAALGHRSIRSTQIYTHPTVKELRDAIEKTGGQD